MKLVVVGGHSRNIGKTSLAAGIIAATADLGWTAMKLTQYGHQVCSTDGDACECAVDDPLHPFSITREESRESGTDTARFLAAGAHEAYWVRSPDGRLGDALPAIRSVITTKPYVILESNSVMRFLQPDAYLVVLDWETADFKTSARANLDRADAFVILETERSEPAWENVARSLIERRPLFRVSPPHYVTPELKSFLIERLLPAGAEPRP